MKRLIWILGASAALVWAQDKQAASTNIELTVYLISGSAQGTADEVPQDLEPTMKQLHSVFAYKSYKLSESFMLRGRLRAGASAQGMIPGNAGIRYEFRYAFVEASSDVPPVFRISGLKIILTKNGFYRRDTDGKSVPDVLASISTDLDIREGQKTVVGKSSVTATGDALILVIVPKLVQ
jgi:hypothetical protein